MNKSKILIVDDEQDIREILQFNLENEGFTAELAASAEEALPKIEKGKFSLVLLDVMMGRMSGFQLAKILKDNGNHTPIIFLTAKNTENDMLTGFSIGADDFIRKPFSIKEVIVRIKSLLKRTQTPENNTEKSKIEINNRFSINLDKKSIDIDGNTLTLTKKEFEVLILLVQNEERIFTRDEILSRIWQHEIVLDRTIDVHIAKIRKKLGVFASCIVKRSGYGYYFKSNL
jgi:DNA-binding response OmpR family regulator